jgi:type I restriction enzyme S subunit
LKTYTLGDVSICHDKKRIPVREFDRRKGKYPYYGASGIVDYVDDYIFDGEYLLVAEDGENLKSKKLPLAFIAKGKFWVNNHAHIIQGNHLADTKFLMYYLQAIDFSEYLTGSTMPKLTQDNLNRIPVQLPPLETQKEIAHILGTLDDKIELNRRMNKSLEEIAQALFKHWFIDFEFPNAEGKPYKSSGGTMIDSELGPIPHGWKVGTIGDVCAFEYGKALKSEVRQQGTVPVMGSNGQVGWHNEALVKGPGVVIGRKGNPGTVKWVHSDFFPIDTTFYAVPKSSNVPIQYIYFLLLSSNLHHLNADSAVPGLNRDAALGFKITIPNNIELIKYKSLIETMQFTQNKVSTQNIILDKIKCSVITNCL